MAATRRLNWRDGIATPIVAFTVLLTLAVTNAWGWPVVGSSYRTGAIALFIVGLAACASGGQSLVGGQRDAFLTIGRALSGVAVLLFVGALVFGTAPVFVGLEAVILVKWVLATIHHVAGGVRPGATRMDTT
jgi:hypothetical protein